MRDGMMKLSLISVVVLLIQHVISQSEFVPKIAVVCGRPVMHYTQFGWLPDYDITCLSDENDFLSYCRKVYAEMPISSVKLSTEYESIPKWCESLNELCVSSPEFTFNVLPMKCLVERPLEDSDALEDSVFQEEDFDDILTLLEEVGSLPHSSEDKETLQQEIIEDDASFDRYFHPATSETIQSENMRRVRSKAMALDAVKKRQYLLELDFHKQKKGGFQAAVDKFRERMTHLYEDALKNQDRLLITHLDRMQHLIARRELSAVHKFDSLVVSPNPSVDEMERAVEELVRTVEFSRLHIVNRFERLQQPGDEVPVMQFELQRLEGLLTSGLSQLKRHEALNDGLLALASSVRAEYRDIENKARSLLAAKASTVVSANPITASMKSQKQRIADLVESRIKTLINNDPENSMSKAATTTTTAAAATTTTAVTMRTTSKPQFTGAKLEEAQTRQAMSPHPPVEAVSNSGLHEEEEEEEEEEVDDEAHTSSISTAIPVETTTAATPSASPARGSLQMLEARKLTTSDRLRTRSVGEGGSKPNVPESVQKKHELERLTASGSTRIMAALIGCMAIATVAMLFVRWRIRRGKMHKGVYGKSAVELADDDEFDGTEDFAEDLEYDCPSGQYSLDAGFSGVPRISSDRLPTVIHDQHWHVRSAFENPSFTYLESHQGRESV